MIDGLLVLPLRKFEDERGWFVELRRESLLPKPTLQTNLSFSRKGVIRGLHYHERGQDDLFVCLSGMARVVVIPPSTESTWPVIILDSSEARNTATLAMSSGCPTRSYRPSCSSARHVPPPDLTIQRT